MELFERIYLIVSYCVTVAVMIVFAKYVYMEPCFQKVKNGVVYFAACFVIICGVTFCPGELGELSELGEVITLLGSFSIMICITRKKKRIRGLFLVFPVLGMSAALCMVPVFVIVAVMGISLDNIEGQKIYDMIGYVFVIPFIFLLVRNSRRWKIQVDAEVALAEKEQLSKWERRLLNVNGLAMLFICGFIIMIQDIGAIRTYERYFVVGSAFFVVIMGGTAIMMVLKSNSTHYYRASAKVNAYYLSAQLEHFRAYQQTQRETRRIRHDMKNHLLCIKELYEQNKQKELGAYIEALNEQVTQIDQELHIGNEVADAILNEKNVKAKANGIVIHTEGSLSGIESITPLDICTLFANALDNCLEALKGEAVPNPFIEISIRREKRMLLISFINPVAQTQELQDGIRPVTTKKNREEHGFGLENIRITATKYKGEISCGIVDWEQASKVFRLEIMLLI